MKVELREVEGSDGSGLQSSLLCLADMGDVRKKAHVFILHIVCNSISVMLADIIQLREAGRLHALPSQLARSRTAPLAARRTRLILDMPVAKVRRSESSTGSPSSSKSSPTSVNVRTFLATAKQVTPQSRCSEPAEASETPTQHQKSRAGCTRVIVSV
eukprot:s4475_g4.t2